MSTTPGRKTVVTLNQPVTIAQQGSWWQDLSLEKISTGAQSTNGSGSFPGSTTTPPNGNFQVTFLNKIGWKIQQYQETLNVVHELTTTDAQDFDPAGWASTSGNTGWFSAYAHRRVSELTGLGTTTDAVGPNDKYFQKQVKSGDSIAVANTADQTAYPPPNAPGVDVPLVSMDRVYTQPANHNPDEDVWFRFFVPVSTPFKTAQIICHLMFSNIPTVLKTDGVHPGAGQYSLTLYADGTAILQECTKTTPTQTWAIRARMNWCNSQLVAGQMHVVSIKSDAHVDENGLWQGSIIQFGFDNTNASGFIQEAAQFGAMLLAPSLPQTYQIVQVTPTQPTLAPLRLDVRRDIFLSARLQKSLYQSVGYLNVKLQEAPLLLRNTVGDATQCPLIVTVYCDHPGDSSIQCNIYENGSGTQLPIQSTAVNAKYFSFKFTCPLNDSTNERFFKTIITLNASTDKTKSPTVRRVTFVRDPQGYTSDTTPLVVPIVSQISMSGPDRDFTHETMTFTAPDPLGTLDTILQNQGGQTVTVDCYYDPNDNTKFSRFFQGRMAAAKRLQRGSLANVTGYTRWGRYQCTAMGEWSTLAKLTTYKVYNFAVSKDGSGKPEKITEAIKAILADHYSLTQIDVPDLAQRFFVESSSDGSLNIESFTPIGPLLASWVRDYLGGYMVWDANYTNGGAADDTNGCWRILIPPSPGATFSGLPGYNYACQFLTDRYAGTKGIPADNPYAYPTLAAFNPDGSNLVQTFCRKFSASSQIIPPEGNVVIVTGIGVASSQGNTAILGAAGKIKLSRSLHNWKAADFGQNTSSDGHPAPDPTHPDYTDGIPQLIYYSDPALRTQAAIDYVARRIFDMSMHSQKYVILEAPYVLISPQMGDTKWIRPRPLRFGDPVLLNGVPYFVWTAPNGSWGEGNDKNQMAAYELRTIPALTATHSPSGTDEQWRGICSEIA